MRRIESLPDNCATVIIDGRAVLTLRDLLPETPGLKVLFIGKTPAPKSVAACHYFQGTQGRMFWNLGHVLSPTEIRDGEDDWRRRVWDYIIRRELGLPADLPQWADYPAVGRHAITAPHLMRAFERFNRDKSYGAQVKPFNFMLTVQHDPFAASRFKDGLRLVGPFEPNPDKWLRMKWLNLHGEEVLGLANGPYAIPDTVGYRSYRDLIAAHAYRKETKRTGPDGLPCEERARGVLGRRTVRPLRMIYIGKEADRHEERDLAADVDDLITSYGNLPEEIEERIIRPTLRAFLREVADATGID